MWEKGEAANRKKCDGEGVPGKERRESKDEAAEGRLRGVTGRCRGERKVGREVEGELKKKRKRRH